jgi:hypothetical protein
MNADSFIVGASAILIVVTIVAATVVLSKQLRANRKESLSLWEVINGYNEENIRRGRDLSNKILKETQGVGLPSYGDYNSYFAADSERSGEKQYLHDLVSYYHQLGLLIWTGEIDAESVFLLIGPGFIDRWNVIKSFGTFYVSNTGSPDTEIHYGGIYLFYTAYMKWSKKSYPLQRAIRAAHSLAVKSIS